MNEKRKLEIELAYEAAAADIESHCSRGVQGDDNKWWHDTRGLERADADWVARAVHYLDLCGLLLRHPEYPAMVQVLPFQNTPNAELTGAPTGASGAA